MSKVDYKESFVTRGALSPDELQARLARKAHRFKNKKKQGNKYACRSKIDY